jgi:hypothetical protein
MIAPKPVYTNKSSDYLSDFRTLLDHHPEALYWDPRTLARTLCCSEIEIDEARRWVVEDSLEIRA